MGVLLGLGLALAAAPAAADPARDLLTAARRGDVDGIRRALRQGAAIDGVDPEFGQSALIRAAMFGQRAAAEALLTAHADARIASNLSRTALHWAAASGSADIVLLLLKAGAPLEVADAYGETPLDYAATAGQPAAARALLNGGARVDRLKKPLSSRLPLVLGNGVTGPSLEVLLVLIAARQGLETPDENSGRTALLTAADYAHRRDGVTVISALVKAGANTRAATKDGRTAHQLIESDLARATDSEAIANLKSALQALK